MISLSLSTQIKAPRELVFDLARDIDLHTQSAGKTREQAIAGKVTGLMGLNDRVTWRGKHFGIYQNLSVQITAFDKPVMFVDEMTQGAFKSMKHTHIFSEQNGITEMKDLFQFEAPLGLLGLMVERLVLKAYMTRFLVERNQFLKAYAESLN